MSTPYAAPQAAPAAPGPQAYAGPAPAEKRTHLGHAIASEWTKIRSVRSTIWTLAVMFVLVVGIGLLVAFALNSSSSSEMPVLGGGLFGMMFGQLAIITLGVLTVTSEYSTGMIRTTMTVCPKRTRVLTAKAIVFFTLSFVMTLAATSLTALIHFSMLEGKPLSPTYDTVIGEEVGPVETATATSEQWLQATVGVSLFVALLGLLSLAVGTLLRSTPGGVTAMLGLVLLPFIVSLFLMPAESTRGLGEALSEYSVLNGLSTLYHMPFDLPDDPSQINGWPLLALLAAVTAAALIGAYARISTRDV